METKKVVAEYDAGIINVWGMRSTTKHVEGVNVKSVKLPRKLAQVVGHKDNENEA